MFDDDPTRRAEVAGVGDAVLVSIGERHRLRLHWLGLAVRHRARRNRLRLNRRRWNTFPPSTAWRSMRTSSSPLYSTDRRRPRSRPDAVPWLYKEGEATRPWRRA